MIVHIGSSLLVATTWAQDAPAPATAPAAEPPTPAPKAFHLSVVDLYVGMESEYDWRRVRYSGSGQRNTLQQNEDFRLHELVGTTLAGDVYDPNLLEYRAMLELGLSQARFREKSDGFSGEDRHSGFLHEYDVSIDALKTKPVSFNAYARRSDNRVPRRFLPSLHELQTEAGVSSLVVAGPTTTEIGLSWRDVDRRGNRDRLDDEELETSRFYLDHTWTISDDQKLRVQYDHDREQSKYQGSRYNFDTRRDEIRVEHELAFGPARQHLFDTFFRYNAEQGDLALDELELVPRLTLTHNDKFKTIYRYGFYKFQQGALDVGQHKFDVQAIYRPRDDLRITLDGFGLYERADLDVETREFGGGFDVNYSRPTPLGGLNMNLASAYQRAEVTGDAGKRFVHAEAHALGGSRPIFLKQRGVVRSSVVAHDERRTRYYIAGIDYQFVLIGRRARVERIFSGRIAENEVVYFDYQYVVPAHASLNEYRNDFLIEHTFSFGLTPYYGYEGRCQDVESSEATPWKRDDTHRHRLGIRYEQDRWAAGTEYEIFDDTVEPYDAWHLTGRAAIFQSAAHSLDLSGELSRYWYEGGLDQRRVWWFDMDLTDHIQVNQWLSLTNGLAYHWQEDTKEGTTNGVDVECGLQYTRGYLTVELTVEYDLLSIVENRDSGCGLYLNIQRNLTHLLPGREGVE